MLSGDSKSKTTSTPAPAMPGTGGTGDPQPGAGGDPGATPSNLANITNLLPNDAQVVVSYPMDRAYASNLRVEGFNESDVGGFSAERFKANMGFGIDEVNRIIATMRMKDDKENDWVFTVLQTKKPYKADTMKAALRLTPSSAVKSKTKSYDVFQINGDLDSLSNVLLKFNQPREQFQVHFLDANTMVFGDPSVMKKFLEGDAKPEYLSKEPSTDAPAASGPPTSAPGIGGPGAMPGGAPLGTPSPAPGGLPGGAPGGAPMTMPGGMPGAGIPGGGQVSTPPPAEVAPANYMTLEPTLKNILDRVEVMKPNEKTKQKEVASIVTFAAVVSPATKPTLVTIGNTVMVGAGMPPAYRVFLNMLFYSNATKSAGGSLAGFNGESVTVTLAAEMQNRKDAEAQEKLTRPFLPFALPWISSGLGLTIKVTAPSQNTQGPGGATGFPGTNPGGLPGGSPGGTPITLGPGGSAPPLGGSAPPLGAGLPGGTPGGLPGGNPGGTPGSTPGGNEKDSDGTLALTLIDRTLVCTLDLQMNNAATEKLAGPTGPTRRAMLWLKSQGDLASTRDRFADLARGRRGHGPRRRRRE